APEPRRHGRGASRPGCRRARAIAPSAPRERPRERRAGSAAPREARRTATGGARRASSSQRLHSEIGAGPRGADRVRRQLAPLRSVEWLGGETDSFAEGSEVERGRLCPPGPAQADQLLAVGEEQRSDRGSLQLAADLLERLDRAANSVLDDQR